MRDKCAKALEGRDGRIGRIADRQYGVVSWAQLVEAGLSPAAIGRAVEAGRLRPMMRGVYAVGHMALAEHSWWQAALLACGPGSTLSHWSAAEAWRLRFRETTLPVDVTVVDDGGRRRTQVRTHRQRLEATEIVRLDSLQVTSSARTVVDLAPFLSRRELRGLIERAQDRRLFSARNIAHVLSLRPNAKGCRPLKDLIALMGPDADNARTHLERLLMQIVRTYGLPRPKVNFTVAGRERDFVWLEARLVLEADGGAYHASKERRRRDNRRDRELQARGWRTLRFTYEEIALEPDQVAAAIRTFLH